MSYLITFLYFIFINIFIKIKYDSIYKFLFVILKFQNYSLTQLPMKKIRYLKLFICSETLIKISCLV